MSASVDEASQGGAAGAGSSTVTSSELNLQTNLTLTAEGSSPPASAVTAVATAAPPPSAAFSVASRSSKRNADPVTTVRSSEKGRKKSAADKIGKGKHIFCKKNTVFHIISLLTEAGQAQSKVLKGLPPGQCLFGTVIAGNGKSGYTVKFDLFPQGQNELVVT